MTVSAGRPSNGADRRVVELADEVVDVQRHRRHPSGDLTFPDLARAVPVDLDPVPIGVAEVERLADEVVGEPDERHPIARGVCQPACEIAPLRQRAARSGRAR